MPAFGQKKNIQLVLPFIWSVNSTPSVIIKAWQWNLDREWIKEQHLGLGGEQEILFINMTIILEIIWRLYIVNTFKIGGKQAHPPPIIKS